MVIILIYNSGRLSLMHAVSASSSYVNFMFWRIYAPLLGFLVMSVYHITDDDNVSISTKEDVEVYNENNLLITYKVSPIFCTKKTGGNGAAEKTH